MLELSLPDTLTTSLASGHRWVYRDHVGRFQAPTGSWVRVRAGSFKGVGLWDAESAIAIRIFSTESRVDQDWVRARVQEAWELRAPLRARGTTGYRLIFGEADALPGIVVDLYGQYAVLVSYTKAVGQLIPWVAEAVRQTAQLRGVVRRTKTEHEVKLSVLLGERPPDRVLIEEGGMKLWADLAHGQKTGLFFDHRDNRAYVRELARGQSVLNLFAYNGGFTVAAGLGGASHITSVDVAAAALEACSANLEENDLGHLPHEAIAEDVFSYLERIRSRNESYDLVICDPPSFAKNKDQLRAAERAYRKLLALALGVTRPGGMLCAASCTSQVSPAAFRRALGDAARKARVRLQIVRDIGQPVDHPVAAGHDEGRYLKFLAGRVLRRC